MSSYHTSFTYKDKNSFNEGYIIVAFEPDNGFKDSFLSMENISDDYYDNTKRFDYGAKYTSQSEVQISIIKKDGSDMSVKDFRSCAKWLTGARTNSWLDMCVGDTIIYSFLGKFLNLEQHKMDARTIGARLTFSSLSPWAYSQPQVFECDIGQELFVDAGGTLTKDKLETQEDESPFIVDNDGMLSLKNNVDTDGLFDIQEPGIAICDVSQSLFIDIDGNLIKNKTEVVSSGARFGVNDNGVLCPNNFDEYSYFDIVAEGENEGQYIVGIDTSYKTVVNNESDDLYTYINLDIDFEAHGKCDNLSIYNTTLNEETVIKNVKAKENISISANQFIVSDSPHHKIFGNDFNFVWPRLQPGENSLIIGGGGTGIAHFTYRYPMKIGDCAMDIDVNGNSIICDSCPDNNNNNETFTGTIAWNKITDKPITIEGYGITDAYTIDEVDDIIDNIEVGDGVVIGGTKIDEAELNAMLDEILG